MLNIGKLSPGGGEYYIGEIATSAEDYYTGNGEADGRWVGSLAAIVEGPSHVPDGTMNLVGALRKAMSTTGYTEVKEFQRVEIVVHA